MNGPVIQASGSADVITSQEQADDVLESLGFRGEAVPACKDFRPQKAKATGNAIVTLPGSLLARPTSTTGIPGSRSPDWLRSRISHRRGLAVIAAQTLPK